MDGSSSSGSSLPPPGTAVATRVTAMTTMTNATAPPSQPILTASKPHCACVAAIERSLSASPTGSGGTAAVLTPPATPSPVFNGERSSTANSAANSSGSRHNYHHPHYHHLPRAYEQSILPNPSPKNQNYSKNATGKKPVPTTNLVQDANANDDGEEEPITAIDRNRRKGSYKKRKKLKKRAKHN